MSVSIPFFAAGIAGLILDMDGTLLRGDTPLPGLAHLFRTMRARPLPFMIVTNNATKSTADYRRKMAGFGIDVAEGEILTAGMATVNYVQQKLPAGAPLYVIGQPALRDGLREAGFRLVETAYEPAAALVVGGDPQLTYEKLKNGVLHLQRGAQFIGTNPDLLYPTEEGMVPETGTTLAALQAATGRTPVVIGKPARHLFDLAVARLGCGAGETAVVGDRLETDIRGGQLVGLKTILTTTGIDNELTIRQKNIHPDRIVDGLDALAQLLKGE